MNKLLLGTAISAVSITLTALSPTPFELRRDVARVMPEEVLIYAEAPGFTDLCAQGLQHPLIETLLASPLGELIQEEASTPPAFALGMLNMWAGRPVLPTLAKLTSGGLAIGLIPSGGQRPIVCLVARGDAEEWELVITEAMTRIAEELGLPPERVVPPHQKIRDMDVWMLGDKGAMALSDGLFVACTDKGVLRHMLDLSAEKAMSGLAAREDFAQARSTYRSEDAFIWSWFDLESLEEVTPNGLKELRSVPGQPAAQFLFGAAIANIFGARTGVAEVRFQADRIELNLVGIDAVTDLAEGLLASRDTRPFALPAVRSGETARGIIYRDLAGLFRDRVELFPVDVQPGFAKATSNLALFFGGKDITDEVLPGLDPWIGVVSRPVTFDERAVPDLPLPGAALLIGVDDPDELGPQLIAAVQSMLSVLNIEAAQKQRPILTVNLEVHEGVTITYGRYRRPAEGEGVDMRYNLEPACAMVGETFVLGTHRSLVEDLVGQLVSGDMAPAHAGESLVLSGPEVARMIAANEEALALNAVLTEGKSEKQARKDLRGLYALAQMVRGLELQTARTASNDLRASLVLLLEGGR